MKGKVLKMTGLKWICLELSLLKDKKLLKLCALNTLKQQAVTQETTLIKPKT
jgi:hypothetical protein